MSQTNQIIHKVWGEVEGGETEKSGCNKIAKGLAVLSDQQAFGMWHSEERGGD